MSIKVMKQALEALEYWAVRDEFNGETREAITALRTAIEQAEKQEPVAWLKVSETFGGFGKFVEAKPNEKGAKPVYTHPAPAAPVQKGN